MTLQAEKFVDPEGGMVCGWVSRGLVGENGLRVVGVPAAVPAPSCSAVHCNTPVVRGVGGRVR